MNDLERRLVEMHRGHNCETWNLLLGEEAARATRRIEFIEYELRYGTRIKVPGGHEFYLDGSGEIDSWRVDGDYHNGPACAACDESWCEHCHEGVYTEQCPTPRRVNDVIPA